MILGVWPAGCPLDAQALKRLTQPREGTALERTRETIGCIRKKPTRIEP
jgi:hypothetical protein